MIGAESEDSRAEIRSALTSLSPVPVRSVVLAGAFDMTAAEVAAYEDIPLGTAKSRIRAAKQRLRRELNSFSVRKMPIHSPRDVGCTLGPARQLEELREDEPRRASPTPRSV